MTASPRTDGDRPVGTTQYGGPGPGAGAGPDDDGVEGNSRLTGVVAAILLVALAVEGFTLLGVRQMLTLHAFIGLFVVPVVLVKLGSTGYRMLKYYIGDERFTRRGPPHIVLRLLGPVVVVTTVSLLASGIALLVVGPGRYSWLGLLHRASFVLWFASMVVHVLGHLLETARLATADLRPKRYPRVAGARWRTSIIVASLLVGLGLGVASTQWGSGWRNRSQHDHSLRFDR